MNKLVDLITRAKLEDLAGTAAFLHGEKYYLIGAVGCLRVTEDMILAKVEGADIYSVSLRESKGSLAYDCTCPRAADGFFCKHCVALGLAWIADRATEEMSVAKPGDKDKRRTPWQNIKSYLVTQSPETLIKLLIDVAQSDERLYQSLLLNAERTVGGGDVAKVFRRAIDEVTRVHGFIDWRQVGAFSGNIDQIVDSLEELLKPGTVVMLVELAEYAIERIEGVLEQVDDSSGDIGTIVYRLGEMHVKACSMAKPDAAALAERLFRLETSLPFNICRFDAVTYQVALGEEGMRRYRELAEVEWVKIEPLTESHRYDSHRAAITNIMERLAEASGDIDEMVAIKSKDLSASYCYLRIAELLGKANRADEALNWAERGLNAFPNRPDNGLRDFLVTAYLKRDRSDDALHLTWVQFEEHPGLEPYKKLCRVAKELGVWPAERECALGWLAKVINQEAARTTSWKPKPSAPNCSIRVSIALWEEDFDAAWEAVHQGVCGNDLLVALAGKLELTRIDDAISLYRRVVPLIVDQTNNAAYDEGIKLIRKMGELMRAQGRLALFGDYLAELRVQFKPKRNFIKLLDGLALQVSTWQSEARS